MRVPKFCYVAPFIVFMRNEHCNGSNDFEHRHFRHDPPLPSCILLPLSDYQGDIWSLWRDDAALISKEINSRRLTIDQLCNFVFTLDNLTKKRVKLMEIYLELRKRKEHSDRESKLWICWSISFINAVHGFFVFVLIVTMIRYRRLELDSISIQVILSTL